MAGDERLEMYAEMVARANLSEKYLRNEGLAVSIHNTERSAVRRKTNVKRQHLQKVHGS